MPEDTESLRRDCQVERESQGLDFAEKAHWCAIWSQGRGPGRGNDYWQCHQGISERHGNDIRYGRHLQGGQSGNRVQLWCRGEQCRFWIHVLRGRQLQRLRGERENGVTEQQKESDGYTSTSDLGHWADLPLPTTREEWQT